MIDFGGAMSVVRCRLANHYNQVSPCTAALPDDNKYLTRKSRFRMVCKMRTPFSKDQELPLTDGNDTCCNHYGSAKSPIARPSPVTFTRFVLECYQRSEISLVSNWLQLFAGCGGDDRCQAYGLLHIYMPLTHAHLTLIIMAGEERLFVQEKRRHI